VSASEELETSVRIYTNIDAIKQKYGPLLDPAQGLSVQGRGGRRLPDPYLMWDIDMDRIIWRLPETHDAKIIVAVHECLINVQKSRPTGTSNESI